MNRPLLVSFKTEQDVIEISRKLPKLKKATTEIKNLGISLDRSLKEREEVRKLVTKAKKKLERSGTRKLCISGSMNAGSKNLEESKTRKLNFWYTKIDTLTQTKHQELIKLIEDKKNPPCNCSRRSKTENFQNRVESSLIQN